jgi:hypothetical protein
MLPAPRTRQVEIGLHAAAPRFDVAAAASRGFAGATGHAIRSIDLHLLASLFHHALSAIAVGLVAVSFAGQTMRYYGGRDHLLGLIDLFNIDAEGNVPTTFSILLLGFSAALLAIVRGLQITNGQRNAWFVATLGATYLTFDEACQFHERLTPPVLALAAQYNIDVTPTAWIYAAIPAVLVLALVSVPSLRHLPRQTRNGILMAAAVFLGGSIGVETLGSLYSTAKGTANLGYQVFTSVEELMEMLGVILLGATLLRHIAMHYPVIQLGSAHTLGKGATVRDG